MDFFSALIAISTFTFKADAACVFRRKPNYGEGKLIRMTSKRFALTLAIAIGVALAPCSARAHRRRSRTKSASS